MHNRESESVPRYVKERESVSIRETERLEVNERVRERERASM